MAAAAAKERARKGVFETRVVSNRSICREHYRLILEVEDFPAAEPGQFMQILCAEPDPAGTSGGPLPFAARSALAASNEPAGWLNWRSSTGSLVRERSGLSRLSQGLRSACLGRKGARSRSTRPTATGAAGRGRRWDCHQSSGWLRRLPRAGKQAVALLRCSIRRSAAPRGPV